MNKNWQTGQGLSIAEASRRAGIIHAALFLRDNGFDESCAVGACGFRLSDIVLCKFNVTTRKRPRKVPKGKKK